MERKHDNDAGTSPLNGSKKAGAIKSPTNSMETQLKNDLMNFSSPI
jgi:hypothetical protein